MEQTPGIVEAQTCRQEFGYTVQIPRDLSGPITIPDPTQAAAQTQEPQPPQNKALHPAQEDPRDTLTELPLEAAPEAIVSPQAAATDGVMGLPREERGLITRGYLDDVASCENHDAGAASPGVQNASPSEQQQQEDVGTGTPCYTEVKFVHAFI